MFAFWMLKRTWQYRVLQEVSILCNVILWIYLHKCPGVCAWECTRFCSVTSVCVHIHQQVPSNKLSFSFPCQRLLTRVGRGPVCHAETFIPPCDLFLEERASGQQVGALGLVFFAVQGAVVLFSCEREQRVGQEAGKPVWKHLVLQLVWSGSCRVCK